MNRAITLDFSLSADAFAGALQSGIHRVILEQEHLNQINVFPVADSDTGTNLSLSLSASLNRLAATAGRRMDQLLGSVADALLDGARGNSCAIMAQFFQGLSDSSENLASFGTGSFAAAVQQGSDYAHDAISDPRPGTILSVIAAFANSLREQINANGEITFPPLLKNALRVAQQALEDTETQLEVLRKAGVVDAGAKGFVVMVEGMFEFLVHGRSTEKPEIADILAEAVQLETAVVDVDLEFRFCTECMISGNNIDRRKLREQLSSIGNSLVIAGTKKKAKVHIHVNEPESVFELARRYGNTSGEKADDMQQQQHSSHDSTARFAVITDSAADIADTDLERLDIHMVPLRLQFGDRGYLDKVSISASEFFAELRDNPNAPTTSQPAPGDFRRQYQFLASHFPDVVSVSLTGSVSGTLQAAEVAANRVDARGNIHVFNTLNASIGQGMFAVTAAECAAAGLDVHTTLRALQNLIPQTYSFALIKDLKYAIRGGRVPAYLGVVARLLHVTPVLRTTPDGYVSAGGLLAGRKNPLRRFARFVAKEMSHDVPLRLAIGHAVAEERAVQLREMLIDKLPMLHSCEITELGAALGVHGGPGCIVVGAQPYLSPADVRDRFRLS